METSQDLETLKNLGKISVSWLNQVGITTKDQLQQMGAVGAYQLLREAGFRVSLNMVYALEGALLDTHWNKLPQELRLQLKAAVGK